MESVRRQTGIFLDNFEPKLDRFANVGQRFLMRGSLAVTPRQGRAETANPSSD